MKINPIKQSSQTDQPLLTKIPWATFIVLFIIFYFAGGYDLLTSLSEHYDKSAEVFEEMTTEGNLFRRIAIPALFIFALFLLIKNKKNKINFNGSLGWIIIFFILWSVISLFWSIDVYLSFRRIMVFISYWILAFALANRYSIDTIPYFTLFYSTVILFISICCELALGTFTPFSLEYRFAGIMHPNSQAMNCALMLISSFVILNQTKKKKIIFYILAAIALMFLILTKSRMAFTGAVFVIILYDVYTHNLTYKRVVSAFAVISSLLLYSFISVNTGEDPNSFFTSVINLGRDSSDSEPLNGRLEIWATCLDYIEDRPVHGYGFSSFWTVKNINDISKTVGWGLYDSHSSYIELALYLGFIGLISFIIIIITGIKMSFSQLKSKNNLGFLFHFIFSLFLLIHGLTEASVVQLSHVTFLLFWGLSYITLFSNSEYATKNNR